jgi:hypothetical protein
VRAVFQKVLGVSGPEATASAIIDADDRNYGMFVHVNNLSADVEAQEATVADLRTTLEARQAAMRKSQKATRT